MRTPIAKNRKFGECHPQTLPTCQNILYNANESIRTQPRAKAFKKDDDQQ
jgi:hypothetical protein